MGKREAEPALTHICQKKAGVEHLLCASTYYVPMLCDVWDRRPEEPWSAADCPFATLDTEEEVLSGKKLPRHWPPVGAGLWRMHSSLFLIGSSFPLTSPVPSLFQPAGVDTCRGFYASFFSRCLFSLQFLPKMPVLGQSWRILPPPANCKRKRVLSAVIHACCGLQGRGRLSCLMEGTPQCPGWAPRPGTLLGPWGRPGTLQDPFGFRPEAWDLKKNPKNQNPGLQKDTYTTVISECPRGGLCGWSRTGWESQA